MIYLKQTLKEIIKGCVMNNSNIVKNYDKVLKMESVAGDNLVEVLKCDEYGKFTYKDFLLVKSILKITKIELSDLDDLLFDVQVEVSKKFK
jgi:hypothetical protein